MTDGSGSLANNYLYDGFGVPITSSGTFPNSLRYTSRDFDSESSLEYYRARYYDPQIGRFLSEDPISFSGGNNFYAYVYNSPVRLVDPTGTESSDWQERWNDYWKVGNIFQVIQARNMAAEALAAAVQWSRQHNIPIASLHNGPGDAFRHCFWSCTMTRYLGEITAEIIADEHEKAGDRDNQPLPEEQMDRANNLAGRTAALNCPKNNKNCWDLCTDLYNNGQLHGLRAIPMIP